MPTPPKTQAETLWRGMVLELEDMRYRAQTLEASVDRLETLLEDLMDLALTNDPENDGTATPTNPENAPGNPLTADPLTAEIR